MIAVLSFVTTLATLASVESFTFVPKCIRSTSTILESSTSRLHSLLSLDLEKPLGIILEEVEEGGSEGVKVEELSDSGSAYASAYRDNLVGLKVARVMDSDVTSKFLFKNSQHEILKLHQQQRCH